jgi:hypothetical protein
MLTVVRYSTIRSPSTPQLIETTSDPPPGADQSRDDQHPPLSKIGSPVTKVGEADR